MMTRSIPSLSWLVVRRRLTAPLSIRSCCVSRLFSRTISCFSSSSCRRETVIARSSAQNKYLCVDAQRRSHCSLPVYLLVGAALPCCSATCRQGDPPRQLEQAAGLLQGLLQGVHGDGEIPQLLLLHHLQTHDNMCVRVSQVCGHTLSCMAGRCVTVYIWTTELGCSIVKASFF